MSKLKDSYNQRVTQSSKDSNEKQYYKEQLDLIDSKAFSRVNSFDVSDVSEYKRKKVNYELFNNKLNLADFSYVCQPFGAEVGELPAQMANRDIISGKIKAVLGTEAKRPFTWRIVATNEEATTRKEQEKFSRISAFVVSKIMQPIQEQIELKYQQELQGKKLSPDEEKKIQEQIAQEIQTATPDEVLKYMSREHQDPAEVLSRQIMKYLMKKETITDKFLKAFKHGCISGEEIYWVGLINNEPTLKVVNPLYFDYAKAPDQECIEDSEWGVTELRMTPSQLIGQFRSELEDSDIDSIYEDYPIGGPTRVYDKENLFSFEDEGYDGTIRVIYAEWKGERKVGFLNGIDENGELTSMMVSEDYKFNKAAGDVDIDWQWIPEVHHGYKICLSNPIYLGLGPIPGQHKDLDNLNECKLRFIGVCYDNMNAETTSIVDRMKAYQYYYNIVMYRIELLMASDKGKIILMNINAIPKSAGINLTKFQYFLESNKIAYFNPSEEGNKAGGNSAGETATVLDMSLVSDISKYMNIAEYIERRCGNSVGITDAVEGQASADQSVRNNQTNLNQSSNILEPYFQLHNIAKRNVLQRLIETAKVGYVQGKPRKIAFVMDDMSSELLDLSEVNQELLDNSTLGLFVGDSTNDANAKQQVEALAHAAMQTQQLDLLDIVKIIRSDDIQEAEELLEVGTQKAQQIQSQTQQRQQQAIQQEGDAQRQHEQEQWAHEADMIKLKGAIEKDIKVTVGAISAMGFDPNKDEDSDGIPDVLEVAKAGVDAEIRMRKQVLDEKTQADDNANKQEELKIKAKQVEIQGRKPVASK